jgi:hypothetical protein
MASWFDSVTWLIELRMDLLGGSVAWYDAGLTSTPVSTTATWVDVSDRVVSFTTRRGRNDELDLYTAGTAVLRLDNRDRSMDPTYALGPYYGQLTPRQRIRIRCTYGGVTYGVWHGVVDDWPQSWQVPSLAYVDLPCTDLTYLLSVAEVPSAWEAYVESLEPWAWYRLGTDGGLDNSGNGRDGTVYLFQPIPAPGIVAGATTGGMTGDPSYWVYDGGATPSVTACTVAVMVQDTNPSSTVTKELAAVGFGSTITSTGSDDVRVDIYRPPYDSFQPSMMRVLFSTSGGNIVRWFSSTDVSMQDGAPHHIAVTVNGTTLTAYIDGSQASIVDTTGSVGTPAFGNRCFSSPRDNAIIDEVVFESRALTPVEVARLAALAHGEASARTDEWADLVLDAIDWPAGDRMLGSLPFADATFLLSAGRDTPFDGTLATVFDTPTSALAALRQLERTEQGRCFIDRDGRVVFRTRTWSLSATRTVVSQATFGDSGAELGYTDLSTNESLAAWLVSRYKDPSTRVVSMTVEVRAATATIAPAVLGLELGDLVTVRRRPQNVGAVLEVVATVEGIAHTVTADGRWRVQIQTGKRMVPAGTSYAVVGTATVGGTAVIAP